MTEKGLEMTEKRLGMTERGLEMTGGGVIQRFESEHIGSPLLLLFCSK
jgi:hypothetical protein